MLISHKFKFIFIRTVKTAGTSIEIQLSNLMSDKDVVTEIKPVHEKHNPRNQIYNNKKFFNHMSAKNIRDIIGDKIFRNYYKFCVEREPVDKCISHFSMFKNSVHHKSIITKMSWKEYINSHYLPIDYLKYTENEKIIVDEIIKYEDLQNQLQKVLTNLGVKFKTLNENAKSNFRKKISVTLSDKLKIYEVTK